MIYLLRRITECYQIDIKTIYVFTKIVKNIKFSQMWLTHVSKYI